MNRLVVPCVATLASVMAAPSARAQMAEDKSPGLHGKFALGYSNSRGNTNTLALSGDVFLEYRTEGPWLFDSKFFVLRKEQDEATIEQRYDSRVSGNYYWTSEDYGYVRLDWRRDNFGSVREEWIPGAGYGRVVFRNDSHDLKVEVGAGYRFAELADGTQEESPAGTTGLRYTWDLSESAQFYQNLMVQWSPDNTFMESETGLRTKILADISAKLSYLVKRNSSVPEGRANSDFLTIVGVDYAF
jgi:putative salt-induced outer membrane protein YdiY